MKSTTSISLKSQSKRVRPTIKTSSDTRKNRKEIFNHRKIVCGTVLKSSNALVCDESANDVFLLCPIWQFLACRLEVVCRSYWKKGKQIFNCEYFVWWWRQKRKCTSPKREMKAFRSTKSVGFFISVVDAGKTMMAETRLGTATDVSEPSTDNEKTTIRTKIVPHDTVET